METLTVENLVGVMAVSTVELRENGMVAWTVVQMVVSKVDESDFAMVEMKVANLVPEKVEE